MILPQNLRLSHFSILLFILYATPIIGVCWFVGRFSVNIPLFDQWILPYLFEKVAIDDLTIKTLFSQHNSHRLFFPKLIFISLAFLSNWNIRWELFFSIGLVILTSLALYQLSRLTYQDRSQISFHFANIFSNFLIFSWVQYENWLWGFQIALFLINLCVILACLVLTLPRIQSDVKLVIAAILCIIASFSSVQGLLSWLAVCPLILILDGNLAQKIKRLVLWISIFLVSSFIYSMGFQTESTTSELSLLIHLDKILHFFLHLIAAPISHSITWNSWIGGLILLIFLGLTFYNIKPNSSYPQNKSLVWISLGLFSILCSALIAIGRSDLGVEYVLVASRYTTHSILLLIACVQLALRWADDFLISHHIYHSFNKLALFSFLVGTLMSLNSIVSIETMSYVKSRFPLIQNGKTCFYLIQYIEKSPFFKTSPQSCLVQLNSMDWIDVIWDTVPRLEDLNFRTFAQNATFISNPEFFEGEITSPLTSENRLRVSSGDRIQIKGWMTLSPKLKSPEIIFFSQNNRQSFFANTYVMPDPTFFNPFLKIQSENKQKWQVEFSIDSFPVQPTVISAWVYSSEENKFIKLRNDVNLEIESLF